jgi:hypothetical protein
MDDGVEFYNTVVGYLKRQNKLDVIKGLDEHTTIYLVLSAGKLCASDYLNDIDRYATLVSYLEKAIRYYKELPTEEIRKSYIQFIELQAELHQKIKSYQENTDVETHSMMRIIVHQILHTEFYQYLKKTNEYVKKINDNEFYEYPHMCLLIA